MRLVALVSLVGGLLAGTSPVAAQLVADGATNIIATITTNVTGNLTVGVSASRTTLIITNGGGVNVSSNSVLGVNSGSSSNSVQVFGANSRWVTAWDLFIGLAGRGNRMLIQAGGAVTTGQSYIGSQGGTNLAVVIGAGSVWTNDEALFVGEYGARNELVVSNGAAVRSGSGWLGFANSSSNNVVWVSGSGSVWSNSDAFFVGYNGRANQLFLTNGAVLQNRSGFLGRNRTSSNNLAVVTGPGSVWRNANALFVGDDSAGNRLVVSNGASVFVATNLVVGLLASATNNQVRIEGGNLFATNSGQSATFEVRRGTNLLNGGVMEVDRLLMVNTAARFVFNAGEFRVRRSQVTNGLPFIVGNGTQPAVMRLAGGTNAFANGLIVSSNATLYGCGTIDGLVVNHGDIRADCPGGVLRFTGTVTNYGSIIATNGGWLEFLGLLTNYGTISNAPPPPSLFAARFGRSFNLTLPAQSNFVYTIEFADQATAFNWTSLTNLVGNGQTGVFRDYTATNPVRFYRAHTASGANPPDLAPSGFGHRFAFSLQTQTDVVYFVDFTTQLHAPAWALLDTFIGNGGAVTFVDDSATNAVRFYRVRIQ